MWLAKMQDYIETEGTLVSQPTSSHLLFQKTRVNHEEVEE
jgi:hypothetical protein